MSQNNQQPVVENTQINNEDVVHLFNNLQAKTDSTRAKTEERKKKAEERDFSDLKNVQARFVDYVRDIMMKKANDALHDPNHEEYFVDAYSFTLPPKRHKNKDVDIFFEDYLVIELIEGAKDSKYLEYFKSAGTIPTLELLQQKMDPFHIVYGYHNVYGNVIQARWDKEPHSPKWTLTTPEEFETKKMASLKNSNQNVHKGNQKNYPPGNRNRNKNQTRNNFPGRNFNPYSQNQMTQNQMMMMGFNPYQDYHPMMNSMFTNNGGNKPFKNNFRPKQQNQRSKYQYNPKRSNHSTPPPESKET